MARPNIVVLRDLQKTLPAAQKLFAQLANTDEFGECITVDELIENLEIGRRNAIDLLRTLEEAGAGEFRLGRKGHPSRLVWSTDPQSMLDKLLGRDSGSADVRVTTTELDSPLASVAEHCIAENVIDHVFMLRPGLRVGLSLPVDLSAREAAVLGDWVRNLSFER